MSGDPVTYLLLKRLRYRLNNFINTIRLMVDFWTALYFFIPAAFLLVYAYIGFINHAPAWLSPRWQMLPALLLGGWCTSSSLRSYLVYSDLVWLFREPQWFKSMQRRGFAISAAFNILPAILLLIAVYPFYLHLFDTPPRLWLYIGFWTILWQGAFMMIKWHLQHYIPHWLLTTVEFFGLAAFLAAWSQGMAPVLAGNASGRSLIIAGGSLLLGFLLAVGISRLLPIRDWERVIAQELAGDSRWFARMMGQPDLAEVRRSGQGRWSVNRWGIPFDPACTVLYFLVKYLLRQKKYLGIYLQILLVGLCILIPKSPLWFTGVFLATAYILSCGLILSVIRENLGHLRMIAPYLSPSIIQDSRQTVLIMGVLPWVMILLISGLLHHYPWPQVFGSTALFIVLAVITVRYVKRFSLI